jgi:hypothetical protein
MQLSSLFNYQGITLEVVIWSLFIGIIIGAFAIWYSRRVLGTLVRALLAAEANSPANSKTFSDLGIKNTFVYKIALRKNGTYRKVVHIADEEPNQKLSINAMKFYVPDEVNFRADAMYNNPKGTTLLGAFVAIFAFLIMAILSLVIIPDIIKMIQDVVIQFGK